MGSSGRDFKDSPTSSPVSSFSPRPEPTQEVTPLLLLSMFAIAARYTEEIMPKPQDGKMWEAGYDFLEKARVLLGIDPASLSIILLLLMDFQQNSFICLVHQLFRPSFCLDFASSESVPWNKGGCSLVCIRINSYLTQSKASP